MPADVTLKFDADTAAYMAKVSRINESHEKTSGHLKTHVDLGHAFEHGLQRSIGHAIGLVAVFHQVTDAIIETTKKAAELNKKIGSEINQLGGNLMSFGFHGEGLEAAMSVVNQMGGRATKEERASLAASMAKAQEERKKKGLPAITEKQFFETMNLGVRGGSLVYGENMHDLSDVYGNQRIYTGQNFDMRTYGQELARQKGGLPMGTVNPLRDLLRSLPPDLKAEGRLRSQEFYNEMQKEQAAFAPYGVGSRQALGQQEVFDVQHPIAGSVLKFGGKLVEATRDAAGSFAGARLERERLQLEQRKVIRHDNPHDEGKP